MDPSNSSEPRGRFTIDIEDKMRRHDLPIITDQQIQQGKADAFSTGMVAMALVGLFIGLIVIIIALAHK
jgi:hypothetical protein